jgi:hypothetical protein
MRRAISATAALFVIAALSGCGVSDLGDLTESGTVPVACDAVRVAATTVAGAAKQSLATVTDPVALAQTLGDLESQADALGDKFPDGSQVAAALDSLSAALGDAGAYADSLAGGQPADPAKRAEIEAGIDDAVTSFTEACGEG